MSSNPLDGKSRGRSTATGLECSAMVDRNIRVDEDRDSRGDGTVRNSLLANMFVTGTLR
jgi:hypothetical protein